MTCHFNNHLGGGMWATLKVSERHQFVKTPKGFPKCEPYLPRVPEASKYSRKCQAKKHEFHKYAEQSMENTCARASATNS